MKRIWKLAAASSILTIQALAAAAALRAAPGLASPDTLEPQDAPAWLLVRSEAAALGSVSWQRLAKIYLKRSYRIVDAKSAMALTRTRKNATSRLIVGTPTDNVLVGRLAPKFGIAFEDGRLRYRGKLYPKDSGIALVTEDPDGAGTLVLMAGANSQAAFNCISVPVDITKFGFVVMTFQKPLLRGSDTSNSERPLTIDSDDMPVVRLDRLLWRARAEFPSSKDEAALHLSRMRAGYDTIYRRALGRDLAPLRFARRQLAQTGMLDAVQARFAKVDLKKRLGSIERKVCKRLGGRRGPRPIVHIIVTQPNATNAQVIGADSATGRARVTLNLAAFRALPALELAAAHEFVHTLQTSRSSTLLDRAIREGVATYVSQLVYPKATDHEALMWSKAKLASAEQHKEKILAAFRAMKDETDEKKFGSFVYLNVPLRDVPGAPDRTAYFVAWLAVRAWRKKNASAPLSKLLTTPPAQIFGALE